MRLVYNLSSNLLLFRGKCFYITKIANNSVGFSCLDFPVFALPSDALKGVEDLRSWEEEWKECRMTLPYKPSTMKHLIFLITICVISLWTLYFGPITFAILVGPSTTSSYPSFPPFFSLDARWGEKTEK